MEGKWPSGGSRNPKLALCFPLGSPKELGGPRRARACLCDNWCLQMNIQALWKNPMELLVPTECNKSSSILEVKCYHFVPHVDAVVVKVHTREMGCLDVFVIYAIKIVQADVTPQFIYCPYDTVALWLDP